MVLFFLKKSKVIFDKSKPSGDKIRVLDTSKANKLGIKPIVVLSEGINEMIKWYIENNQKRIFLHIAAFFGNGHLLIDLKTASMSSLKVIPYSRKRSPTTMTIVAHTRT